MEISVRKATQFTIKLDNVPGELAKATQALTIAGVNLEGFFQTISESKEYGTIHFVTNDIDSARDVLASLGRAFFEKTVLALQYADKPGVVACVAESLANAGVNIEEAYLSTPGVSEDTVLYVGVVESDLQKAEEVIQHL